MIIGFGTCIAISDNALRFQKPFSEQSASIKKHCTTINEDIS